MEEKQVTVDGVTHSLPDPFLVIATENPIEYEGTFPLPEAQLDRFLIRMAIGYPDKSDEISVLESQHIRHPLEEISQVVSPADILEAQEAVKSVYVDRLISEYIVNITSATREHPDVYLGASPRGSLGIYRVAQARAAISGRDYVIPDDVKSVVLPVLSHRIILNPSARMREVTTESVISNVLESVTVPGTRSVIRR